MGSGAWWPACSLGRTCQSLCLRLCPCPRPRRYERKGIEVAARQAEVERAERAAAAEQETQKQRQEQRYKRRMLREVVQWVKGAARAPTEVHNR